MSVHRVMGIENEYGISSPHNLGLNPSLLSAQVLQAYAAKLWPNRERPMRWDYFVESPFNDLRGYQIDRALSDPQSWTDLDVTMPNLVLPNGARFYVDHAHPEYSGPETTNPLDATLWDLAGDQILDQAAQMATEITGNLITLYKNNTDGKGASYGTHENYQVSRSVPFESFAHHLTPFFVTRSIFAGAGRVGIGQESRESGFQISQRADFFEARVGLETTVNRPIINTRDEPHADPEKYRRLHVIVGDANMSPRMTFLKLGVTALVLSMIEDDALGFSLELDDPVSAMHQVSRDLELTRKYRLTDGSEITALEIQFKYLEAAQSFAAASDADAMTLEVISLWREVLTKLGSDRASLIGLVDWVTKYSALESFRLRDNLPWSDSKLKAIDLQYSDIRQDKGLAYLMERSSGVKPMFQTSEIIEAIGTPPADTRAFVRGKTVSNYGHALVGASWESLIFATESEAHLVRVTLPDARLHNREQCALLFSKGLSVADFVKQLQSLNTSA
jgi:proteasome accessory factor A